jgi:hypothetical protein
VTTVALHENAMLLSGGQRREFVSILFLQVHKRKGHAVTGFGHNAEKFVQNLKYPKHLFLHKSQHLLQTTFTPKLHE